MKAEKIAVIDLGTNTFHLLIAEISGGEVKVLCKEKTAVKIGKGGINKGFISSDAYERAVKTIRYYKSLSDTHEVNKIFATATSAIRNARNGYQLVKDINSMTGIEIKVIAGEEEAELIYYGVQSALKLGDHTSLIMDIGGGSVEFILCNSEKIFWKGSFEIGAQRVLDKFQPVDPISAEDVQKIVDFFEVNLYPLEEAVEKFNPDCLVGSSGTFDTLSEINFQRRKLSNNLETDKEYLLPLDDFDQIFLDLLKKNRRERMAIPGMIEMRVDMIVVACILISYVLQRFSLKKIRVSSYALKEGVLNRVVEGKW